MYDICGPRGVRTGAEAEGWAFGELPENQDPKSNPDPRQGQINQSLLCHFIGIVGQILFPHANVIKWICIFSANCINQKFALSIFCFYVLQLFSCAFLRFLFCYVATSFGQTFDCLFGCFHVQDSLRPNFKHSKRKPWKIIWNGARSFWHFACFACCKPLCDLWIIIK